MRRHCVKDQTFILPGGNKIRTKEYSVSFPPFCYEQESIGIQSQNKQRLGFGVNKNQLENAKTTERGNFR